MRLASTDMLKERLGLSTTSNAMTSASSVLAAATPILANILGTPLQETSRQDWFTYRPSRYAGVFDHLVLNLTQGFVGGVHGVYLSTDGLPVSNVVSSLTKEDEANYIIDAEKGVLILLVAPMIGNATVLVDYCAGYADGDTPDQEIPEWLSEAALSATIEVMHTQSITHNKKDLLDMSAPMRRILYSQVNEHIRPRAKGIFPVNTVAL